MILASGDPFIGVKSIKADDFHLFDLDTVLIDDLANVIVI